MPSWMTASGSKLPTVSTLKKKRFGTASKSKGTPSGCGSSKGAFFSLTGLGEDSLAT